MSYIWQIISKLVIDMIGQQAALPEKDAMPLLYLVICTTAVEFIMMWLNSPEKSWIWGSPICG